MILETKEELVKQLSQAWEIIRVSDEALEKAINACSAARTALRNYTKRVHDTTDVRGSQGVGTPYVLEPRSGSKGR